MDKTKVICKAIEHCDHGIKLGQKCEDCLNPFDRGK